MAISNSREYLWSHARYFLTYVNATSIPYTINRVKSAHI